MIRRIACLSLLVLAACHKAAAPVPQTAHPDAPSGIAWFEGSVEDALVAARRENRPVLLYWGARWCPYCHTLKSTVFSRPDFMAKTRLFLTVYLDGDDPGAQRWGDAFHIQGYPTLIILDPDRHEIMRLGAGREVTQYAAALDVALENVQPADALLQSASTGRALNLEECRRLAYNSWELASIDASSFAAQAAALSAAAEGCPASATLERASLRAYAAFYAANAEEAALERPHAQPSALLATLQDQVLDVLEQHDRAVSCADALAMLDDAFFESVRARGEPIIDRLRDAYVADMRDASVDPRYALADQLGFVDAQLRALKDLAAPKTSLPADFVAMAHQRIDTALANEQDPHVRAGLVNASLGILEDLDDLPAAYQLAHAEIARASSPYYYKADLAGIAEKMGRRQEALTLLEEAYRESQGSATRFQWGQLYLSGLLRMSPDDAERIAKAGDAVLGELDGPDRIYRRARLRLQRIDRELRAWNDAANGAHADVLKSLHARMQQICVKIPETDAARSSCDAFLKSA